MSRRFPFATFCSLTLSLGLCVSSSLAEVRSWSDQSGKFKIEAELVEVKDGVAVLKRTDGKRIEVPVAKLSAKDQEFLKSQGDDDPFKVVESPMEGGSGLKPGEVAEPSWDEADEIALVAGEQWEAKAGEAAPLAFKPKAAALPPKTDFFEGLSGQAVNTHAQRAALTYQLKGRGRDDGMTSRLVVVDLASGKVLANATLDGEYTAKAVHPDGKLIVAERKQTIGRDAKHTLVTLTAAGKNAKQVDEWIPYSKANEGSRPVRFAEFTKDGKLITCNEPGTVAVWNFATRKLETYFNIPRTSIPALSPDDKYVGFAGGGKVGLIDLTKRAVVAGKGADKLDFWVKAQFSPSGKRLAASSQQKLMIWDVETGNVLFQGDFPGLALAFGLHFPAENFVLISNEYLVEWESGIKVWQYQGGGHPVCQQSTVFYVNDALVPVTMPHPEATRLLDQAKKQSDLFVVKKGTALALDVSGVPAQYQEEVKKSLTQQIEKVGCKVAPQAPVTVKAKVTGPESDTISYLSAGSFPFNRYASTISYEFAGKPIWSGTQTNVPGFLGNPREKSYQQQIDEAGAKPNLYYFGHANLPEYLQKPSENSAAGGEQTLGVSKVGK